MYNFFDARQCISTYVWRDFLDNGSIFFTECFDLEAEHKIISLDIYKRINQLQWVYNREKL